MKVYGQIIVADVQHDPDSDLSEYEAAFIAIGRHGAEGSYHFNMGEGTKSEERVEVEVTFPDRPHHQK